MRASQAKPGAVSHHNEFARHTMLQLLKPSIERNELSLAREDVAQFVRYEVSASGLGCFATVRFLKRQPHSRIRRRKISRKEAMRRMKDLTASASVNWRRNGTSTEV